MVTASSSPNIALIKYWGNRDESLRLPAADSLSMVLDAPTVRVSAEASDLFGVHSFNEQKHWGCRSPMVIDARTKAHLAPALETDPATCRKVDALAAPGGPLHGVC